MRKWIVIGVVAALVVAGIVVWQSSGSSGSDSNPVLITAAAQPRDLRDEVSVTGTVEREEQLTVNSVSTASASGASAGASAAGSMVSRVYLDDGATLNPGASILAVDGRDSVTVDGAFPFFRRLDVGAEGEDVTQLKAVLAAAGYSPGVVDSRYTEQTRFALAQWQAAHGYPGAAPSVNQSVNVSLQQGSGYKLGDTTSAGLTITPPPVRAAVARIGQATSDAGRQARLTAVRRDDVQAACATPAFSIQASAPQVNKGSLALFVVSASCAPDVATPFTVSITQGSSAVNPPGALSMAAGTTTAAVLLQTINNNLVQPDQTLTVALDNGSGYTVGSPASASTTIVSTTLPQMTVSGTTTVQAGQNAVITVTADQAPAQDTQVNFQVGGSAQPGTDYTAFSPTVLLPAGQTSATLTVDTKTTSTVKPARTIVLSMQQSASYKVGPVSSATVTIAATSGNAAIPVVTIRASTLRVQAGQPAQFTIGLDRALSDQLQINVSYGGNAEQGHDYNPASGLLVVQPGQTALQVSVPTLDNGQVSYDKAVFLTVQPSAGYVVGDPSSAGALIVNSTLPKLSIIGGGGSVASGGGATFTIVADQPPVQDISVQYQVAGTAQQGKDIQPVTGSVILPAGQTSVTVSILTLNTNVFFVPTDMIAILGPTKLGQVFVKEGQIIPTGTPLFSLTETNLAVTIDVSAADRTDLKVGQAVTVEVQGGDQTAPGVITQLDDFITTDKTTQKQTYQGKVQVKGDLGAADGTPVTVKVIKQERLGALTVPIAAVKQDGDGNDVVRVIDVGTGAIREVKVKTGLTEGSYIEVKSGLKPKDVVVVQVDKSS
ncbi:MAG: Calx-beta domain-containing protein [Acidimicrobiia bacterium]